MSKYYIGGVATVAAFSENQHVFTARTLTDSSINISVSSEEIRGGQGAQLLGKFFHTTVFNLSMTDALFDLKYIAGQVGDGPNFGSTVTWKTVTTSNHLATNNAKVSFKLLPGEVMADLDFQGSPEVSDTNYYAWCEQDEDYANIQLTYNSSDQTYSFDANSTADALKFANYEYCITYPVVANGQQVTVNATYTPGIYSLLMRAKLFEGDSCKVSDGKPVGEVIIEVPRFQLDGTIDLAMAMSSPATYALNGSALANGCDCGKDPWYARITQVMTNLDPYAGYSSIMVDPSSYNENGDIVRVFAVGDGKFPKAIPLTYITITNPAGHTVVTESGANKGLVTIASDGNTSANIGFEVDNITYDGPSDTPIESVINGQTTSITIQNAYKNA